MINTTRNLFQYELNFLLFIQQSSNFITKKVLLWWKWLLFSHLVPFVSMTWQSLTKTCCSPFQSKVHLKITFRVNNSQHYSFKFLCKFQAIFDLMSFVLLFFFMWLYVCTSSSSVKTQQLYLAKGGEEGIVVVNVYCMARGKLSKRSKQFRKMGLDQTKVLLLK